MASANLSITVEWPDLPVGPVDDMRPYEDRYKRRVLRITAALNAAANSVREALAEDIPDVRVQDTFRFK